MPDRVTVTVPATSANLGPGFDCLGLALTLRNTITLSRTPGGVTVEIEGEGADSLPRDDWNIVIRAAYQAFTAAGEPIPGLALRLVNHVPAGSGLGSSATAIVGGLAAANALMGGPLSQDELLRLAVEIEGHPDNVAPALLGGLVISSAVDGVLLYRRSPVVPLQVALVKPDIVTSTHEQRAALPEMVRHRDAAANVGRAALVVRALQDGDLALLGAAMQDTLHVPYRKQAITGYDDVVAAAHRAGAAAVTISGAGPSVIAFTAGQHEAVQRAMIEAFRQAGITARGWLLEVAETGAEVTIPGGV